MAEFLCRNWKSSICFERNLTPRSEMFVSQSKLKRTLTFDSVHRFLFKNFSFDQSSVNFQFSFLFFCLKERKSFIPHFNGKFPALDRSMCFFSPKTPLLTKVQWISMQDVAQIGFFFFFTKKKSYLQLVSEGNSLLQTFEQSLTTLVLITHSLFFSFPPLLLRLREVDFIGCYETVDQQTAEPPKTLWICKYVHVEHWVK